MHGPINVKSPKNISKWQMGFNLAFKGLSKAKDCLVSLRHSALWKGKGKGKVHRRTGHESPEKVWRYSSTLSITLALGGVFVQRQDPAALPPGMTRYPFYRRVGGPQGRSGRVRKISPPPGFDTRTVQPVASRYIDWAIPTHRHCESGNLSKTMGKTYSKAVLSRLSVRKFSRTRL
jgi:hypothetical protein